MKLLANLVLRLIAMLPRRVAQAIGHLIGEMNHRLDTRSAKVTRANLALCCPDENLESLTRLSLIETGKTLMETPSVWLSPVEKTDPWILSVEDETLLKAAIEDERGLLMILPHVGNWELFNVFYRRYGRMTALYHPPGQAFLQPLMAEVRSRSGNEMVPTDRRGLATLYRRLQDGGTVVVLPDQVPASGTFVPFFGHDAMTDELAVRLVRKTGASALAIALLRNPDGSFRVLIRRPEEDFFNEDTARALSGLNHTIEYLAREDLAQYQWEYKRFRERPAGQEKIYRFGKPVRTHD